MNLENANRKLQSHSFIPGHHSPSGAVGSAIGLLVIGVFLLVVGSWLAALILIMVSLPVITNYSLVEVNLEERYIREGYKVLWFLKGGKKHPLAKYPYVSVLKKAYSYRNKRAYHDGSQKKKIQYDLYLLSHNHLRRILVYSYDKLEDAQREMEDLAQSTGFEIVKYNPQRYAAQRR